MHSNRHSLPAGPVYPNTMFSSPPDCLHKALTVEQSLHSAQCTGAVSSKEVLWCLVFLLQTASLTLETHHLKWYAFFFFFFPPGNTPFQMMRWLLGSSTPLSWFKSISGSSRNAKSRAWWASLPSATHSPCRWQTGTEWTGVIRLRHLTPPFPISPCGGCTGLSSLEKSHCNRVRYSMLPGGKIS